VVPAGGGENGDGLLLRISLVQGQVLVPHLGGGTANPIATVSVPGTAIFNSPGIASKRDEDAARGSSTELGRPPAFSSVVPEQLGRQGAPAIPGPPPVPPPPPLRTRGRC
jgi:hypothetical protein